MLSHVTPSEPMESMLSSFIPWTEDYDAKNARTVKSAERTLALFELFSLYQRPMTVGEISRELQIPQPSVSMLVRNLSTLGYLEHDRCARTYVPTLRIMLLGSWVNRRFSDAGMERQLDWLMRTTGESVMLAIQNRVYSQYVLGQMPENPDMFVQSGRLRPITCTATGRVLLSLKPNAEIEAIVRRCNAEQEDERLRISPSALMAIIAEVRENGYALTKGDVNPGRSVIAITIPTPVGEMPMALGVGGLTERICAKKEAILAALEDFRAAMEKHNKSCHGEVQ